MYSYLYDFFLHFVSVHMLASYLLQWLPTTSFQNASNASAASLSASSSFAAIVDTETKHTNDENDVRAKRSYSLQKKVL